MEFLARLGPFFGVFVIATVLYVFLFIFFLFKYFKRRSKTDLGALVLMLFLPVIPAVYFLSPVEDPEGTSPRMFNVLGPFALTIFSIYPIAGVVFITRYFKVHNDNFLWVGLGLFLILPLIFISFFADKVLFITLVTLFSLIVPFVGGIALLSKHSESTSKIYLVVGLFLVSLPLISSTNILNSLNDFTFSPESNSEKSKDEAQESNIPPHPMQMQPPMSN